MSPYVPLPAGFVETSRGVFERRPGIYWFDSEGAPRNGINFIWCRPTTVVGSKPYVEFHLVPLIRNITHSEQGYWMSSGHSVADRDATYGWWARNVPITPKGQIILPHAAMLKITEVESNSVAHPIAGAGPNYPLPTPIAGAGPNYPPPTPIAGAGPNYQPPTPIAGAGPNYPPPTPIAGAGPNYPPPTPIAGAGPNYPIDYFEEGGSGPIYPENYGETGRSIKRSHRAEGTNFID